MLSFEGALDGSATHSFATLAWGQNRAPLWNNQRGRWGARDSQRSMLWFFQFFVFTKLGVTFDDFRENAVKALNAPRKAELIEWSAARVVRWRRPRVLWMTRLLGQRRMGNLGDVLGSARTCHRAARRRAEQRAVVHRYGTQRNGSRSRHFMWIRAISRRAQDLGLQLRMRRLMQRVRRRWNCTRVLVAIIAMFSFHGAPYDTG